MEKICQLDRFKSACDIHVCVSRVEEIQQEKKGASPSNGLILTLKAGTTYNGDAIEKCFLKFWRNSKAKQQNQNQIWALNYEMWVYSHVIRSLVDNRVCPNFSRYLAKGKRCSKPKELLKLLGNDEEEKDLQEKEDYRLLVTEYLDGTTLREYLKEKKQLDVDGWLILFQLAVACYALFLSRTTHNDLHDGNVILVENEAVITYDIEGKICTGPP